mgnify:FL=1
MPCSLAQPSVKTSSPVIVSQYMLKMTISMSSKLSLQLESIGLSKQESIIYLLCLEHPKSSPTQLAKQSDIARTSIYPLLNTLKSRGLIREYKKGAVRHYTAVDPKQAWNRYKNDLKGRMDSIDTLAKDLSALFTSLGEHRAAQTYTGKAAVDAVLALVLQSGSDIRWFGSMNTTTRVVGRERFYKHFTLERMKGKTTTYALTDSSIIEDKAFGEVIGDFRRFRFLEKVIPEDSLIFHIENQLFCASVPPNKQVLVVHIEDAAISKLFKLLFDTTWNALPEPNKRTA